MSALATDFDRLLQLINGGAAAEALLELELLLQQQPGNGSALALKAEALRLSGRLAEAADTYQRAAERGGGVRNWFVAGVLLAAERKTDEAVRCLKNALAASGESDEVLDALITTLFNVNRQQEGIEFARRQLALSTRPGFLAHAALLLQSVDLYEESSDAFKKIIELAPDDASIVGAALVPARFTCEWEWIESLQRRIGACYDQGDFASPREYPLTHLTWCADEARNFGVTRAYVERMVPAVAALPRGAARGATERLRVGYVSCDFRNHATMHLMAGLFEYHDRRRFEVFAYDYSNSDLSEYRQRFLNAVEHHVPIHALSDEQAALRIAADQLDILFDLKLYTGGGRPTILGYRPAPLQVAYLGYPGSACSTYIDYVVSDRFVTPDSSTPYFTERFCRLPHTYQCNDRKRFPAYDAGPRALHGLPDDKVVFGAFNQSYKVDRASFMVWMRILAEVPESVLWLLGQSGSSIANLTRHAQLAGIDASRLLFAPFASPREHLARLQLADAVLDTLVCNGHTTTSDALWAGVPVVTCRGRHFASRVSESLLNAMGLPQLVGADADDMVRVAKRIGADAPYRAALREQVASNRLSAPLFDTARFTRDFETAIELMTRAQRSGRALEHIAVPDAGPLALPSEIRGRESAPLTLQTGFAGCPLCSGASVTLGFANCSGHPLWHDPLPSTIEWMRCPNCTHVHTRRYWTEAGQAELLRNPKAAPAVPGQNDSEGTRVAWTSVVERTARILGGYRAILDRETRPIWVDARCGDGALAMTAADCGFAAVGLGATAEAAARMQTLGFNAMQHDFMPLNFEVVPDVVSMMDYLERQPDPREVLRKAATVLRSGGILIIGAPDLTSSRWKAMDADKVNPYWMELQHYHNFSRDRILSLLIESGFEAVDFAVSERRAAGMELYAIRK